MSDDKVITAAEIEAEEAEELDELTDGEEETEE